MPKADWWQVTEICAECRSNYKSAWPTFDQAISNVIGSVDLRTRWAREGTKLHPVRYKIKGITNGKR